MMKILYRISRLLVLLGVVVGFVACEKDIDGFQNDRPMIYFNLPYETDSYGKDLPTRVDGLEYSFALDDVEVQTYVFEVPIGTIGLATDKERTFKVEVIKEETTAMDGDWDRTSIENQVIESGSMTSTLKVPVFRANVGEEARIITLRLVSNDNFSVGYENLLKAKLTFSDILNPPSWWQDWKTVFGEFCREKYVKWMELYYLGADPNVEPVSYAPTYNQPLWYGNMPYLGNDPRIYPSTFMFIKTLKKYFEENEVYPDGDTSKPRISIPYNG